MQYTKPMIDQVFQIRKAAPDHIRAHIKLTNPNLLDWLANIYWDLHDNVLRDLIKQLLSTAGPAWLDLLQDQNRPVQPPTSNYQIYRGQIVQQAEQRSANFSDRDAPRTSATSKTFIYRGRQVQTS